MLEEQNQLKRNPDTNGTSLTCREVNIKGLESERTDIIFKHIIRIRICICCTGCIQSLPAEAKLAKVNDLSPPALSCTREIDAGRVELCGAQ